PAALYIHVPFCARICPYCDFAVAPRRRELEEAYLGALEREASVRLAADFQPATIFIGGGTPSELGERSLRRLAALLAPHRARLRELSIEANPGTLTPRKLDILCELGLTRISLGSQSLRNEQLAALGRLHRAEHTRQS